MSLTHRKSRPLSRTSGAFRDDRLFIVACDDTYAPKQYFDIYQLPRVKVHVVPTTDGTSSAQHVLSRLLEFSPEQDDELWILLDTDHFIRGNHVSSYVSAIKEAKQKGVNVAISRPCFEFWLLLHHLEPEKAATLAGASEVEELLRTCLGSYNKTRIHAAHFPITSVKNAVQRARTLDNTVAGGDIPVANTTRVHLLWNSILSKALPSQIPSELRDVLLSP